MRMNGIVAYEVLRPGLFRFDHRYRAAITRLASQQFGWLDGLSMKQAGWTCLAWEVALLLAMGCKSQPAPTQVAAVPQPETKPEIKAAPATPIAEKKSELGWETWDPEWDRIVEEALPEDLLKSGRVARDVRLYCPRFGGLAEADKRAFWAYFFQALAGAEAGLKPTANIRHTEPEVAVKDKVTKRMVRSEGLLQLTYEDSDRYGCDFDWDADRRLAEHDPSKTILQPKNNLTCGIAILDNQLIALKKPLLSRTSYWATLQPGTVSYRVFAKQMANVPKVCRVDPVTEQAKAAARSRSAGSRGKTEIAASPK
jgi:hypothetical protein